MHRGADIEKMAVIMRRVSRLWRKWQTLECRFTQSVNLHCFPIDAQGSKAFPCPVLSPPCWFLPQACEHYGQPASVRDWDRWRREPRTTLPPLNCFTGAFFEALTESIAQCNHQSAKMAIFNPKLMLTRLWNNQALEVLQWPWGIEMILETLLRTGSINIKCSLSRILENPLPHIHPAGNCRSILWWFEWEMFPPGSYI